jgi:hypothetical protein
MVYDGRPTGYEVQFQGEWMPFDDFRSDPFQEMFVSPFLRQERQSSYDQVRRPGMPGTFGGARDYMTSPRRMGGGPVGSRSSAGRLTPEMIQMLLGG